MLTNAEGRSKRRSFTCLFTSQSRRRGQGVLICLLAGGRAPGGSFLRAQRLEGGRGSDSVSHNERVAFCFFCDKKGGKINRDVIMMHLKLSRFSKKRSAD